MRFALVTLFGLCAPVAWGSTLYTYAGMNYSQASVPFTLSESVQGSFLIGTPLAPNLTGTAVTPLASFSFTDGPDAFSSSNAADSSYFYAFTDGTGQLVSFYLQIIKLVPTAGSLVFSEHALNVAYGPTVHTTLGDDVTAGNGGTASRFTQGTLVATPASAVPEPSTVFLLGTGLCAAVRARRRNA